MTERQFLKLKKGDIIYRAYFPEEDEISVGCDINELHILSSPSIDIYGWTFVRYKDLKRGTRERNLYAKHKDSLFLTEVEAIAALTAEKFLR